MATLELSDDPILTALGVQEMFNVDNKVGLSPPNDVQDVKLVQVLLHLIYFKNLTGGFFSRGSQPRPNEIFDDENLKTDGFCGRITNRWIKAFQADRNALAFLDRSIGGKLVKDGIVGPAPLPSIKTRSGTLFTIIALNVICKRRNPLEYQALLNQGPDALAAFFINDQFGQ
jgi:hypothetical protein